MLRITQLKINDRSGMGVRLMRSKSTESPEKVRNRFLLRMFNKGKGKDKVSLKPLPWEEDK